MPQLRAVSASMLSPSISSALARCMPTARGTSSELAASGTRPRLVNGIISRAERASTTRSQWNSMVVPTPIAMPFTAATSGVFMVEIARRKLPAALPTLPSDRF